jgi:hypothetical protein
MKRRTAIGVLILATAFVGALPTHVWEASAANPLPKRERNIIWRDPGNVRPRSHYCQVGLRRQSAITFVAESTEGTNPKIEVKDVSCVVGRQVGRKRSAPKSSPRAWCGRGTTWSRATVARGHLAGVRNLDRAKKYVGSDGNFSDARFEKKFKGVQKLSDEQSWAYDENPFVGTRELNGLKIMIMLLSNWDSKDRHQASKSSNTKIFIVPSRAVTERLYGVTDWGGTMGKWGGVLRRGKWDCDGYTDQSDDFVKGVKNGMLESGHSGQHTDSIKDNIPVAHARWLLGYLGKLSDTQIRTALKASGASASEVSCFSRAVRSRISHLQAFAAGR